MTKFHLARNSSTASDLNDGLSESTAFKTTAKALSVATFSDTIDVYTGVYPKSEGTFNIKTLGTTLRLLWNVVDPGTVFVVDDVVSGPYITTPARGIPEWQGFTFIGMSTEIFNYNATGSGNDWSPRFKNCRFIDCVEIVTKGAGSKNEVELTDCLFVDCGKGSPLFYAHDKGITGEIIIKDCVFVGCDGGSVFFNINTTLTLISGNVVTGCTATTLWDVTPLSDGDASFSDMNNNTYWNNAITNFAKTFTQSHASLTLFQAATAGGVGSTDNVNPNINAGLKGIGLGDPGGPLDRTGLGNTIRGVGIGFRQSALENAATDWNNAVVTPPGSAILSGGNWELADGFTSSEVELPAKDFLTIFFLEEVQVAIGDEDHVAGASQVDATLNNTRRSIFFRHNTVLPLPAYSEINLGPGNVNAMVRHCQTKLKLQK